MKKIIAVLFLLGAIAFSGAQSVDTNAQARLAVIEARLAAQDGVRLIPLLSQTNIVTTLRRSRDTNWMAVVIEYFPSDNRSYTVATQIAGIFRSSGFQSVSVGENAAVGFRVPKGVSMAIEHPNEAIDPFTRNAMTALFSALGQTNAPTIRSNEFRLPTAAKPLPLHRVQANFNMRVTVGAP